ncbi:HIT domain-containing protein [Candidatus Woesearchaeota archaeon]|nr:HIT domain-containing protein [Candidatus Woesearchaeota archaeon]
MPKKKVFHAHAYDGIPLEEIRAREKKIEEIVEVNGGEIISREREQISLDTLSKEHARAVADSMLSLVSQADILYVDLSIHDRNYIGSFFEIYEAWSKGILIIAYVGNTGLENNPFLQYHTGNMLFTGYQDSIDCLVQALNSCCKFGFILERKKDILYETEHFFVIPSIGQLGIEGYLLICSKQHFEGYGTVLKEFDAEFETVLLKVKKAIEQEYNAIPSVFEHGPKGGTSMDHMHMHILPLPKEKDISDFLQGIENPRIISGFDDLREILGKGATYVFAQNMKGERKIVEVHGELESQYMRKQIEHWLGYEGLLERTGLWNWKTHPDYTTYERTVARLRGKI